MGVGLTFVLIVLIICVSVLFGLYMCLCAENEVKMFADPGYEKRIQALEEEINALKEK